MKIIIGHLFYDLLNLYGESGNVLALQHALETQGIEVEVRNLSLRDEWNIEELDFIYVGTGTSDNQKIAIDYLKNYKEDIREFIENNKFFLATGNSIEIFGKYILNKEKKEDAVGVFDYYTERTSQRRVSECIFKLKNIESEILGFENNEGKTINSKTPIFKIQKGFGSEKDKGEEGYFYKNFYATYLIGPILARNPELLEKICKDIVFSKKSDFNFKEFDLDIEKEAHRRYLKKYEAK